MSKVKLGQVAHEHKGKASIAERGCLPIVGLEHLSSGDIDLLGFDDPGETTFTKAFDEGHVLFGRRRAYLRKASVATFRGICSGDIIAIEADEEKLSPRLLPFIIQNDRLFDYAVENSAGSLSPRVKWQRLAEYEFTLPSLEDQEKLADVLWAAQETKRKYRELLTACDDIVKSRFIEMFGETTSQLLARWQTRTVAECVRSIDTGKSLTCLDTPRENDEWPAVLKLSALSSGSYLPKENKALNGMTEFVESKEVLAGDIRLFGGFCGRDSGIGPAQRAKTTIWN